MLPQFMCRTSTPVELTHNRRPLALSRGSISSGRAVTGFEVPDVRFHYSRYGACDTRKPEGPILPMRPSLGMIFRKKRTFMPSKAAYGRFEALSDTASACQVRRAMRRRLISQTAFNVLYPKASFYALREYSSYMHNTLLQIYCLLPNRFCRRPVGRFGKSKTPIVRKTLHGGPSLSL